MTEFFILCILILVGYVGGHILSEHLRQGLPLPMRYPAIIAVAAPSASVFIPAELAILGIVSLVIGMLTPPLIRILIRIHNPDADWGKENSP